MACQGSDWMGIISMVICIYPFPYFYLIFIVKLFFALLESKVIIHDFSLFQKDTMYNGVQLIFAEGRYPAN